MVIVGDETGNVITTLHGTRLFTNTRRRTTRSPGIRFSCWIERGAECQGPDGDDLPEKLPLEWPEHGPKAQSWLDTEGQLRYGLIDGEHHSLEAEKAQIPGKLSAALLGKDANA